jgi:DNA invertase Pin-like site-specific DNA recombinase
MDALYFRVSSDRQTTENQFADLLQVAARDGNGRDWHAVRQALARCIEEDHLTGSNGSARVVYRVNPTIAESLAAQCVYVEQGKSGKSGARMRPLFEQMKRDAALGRFTRLLVWKVSRLGRDMREVISAVYELADLGVTVIPVKSQTGPITSTMGKLLWAVQAWFCEMENNERSDAIRAGQARARAAGTHMGRPAAILDRAEVVRLRREGRSWGQIAIRLRASTGAVRRAFQTFNS